MQTILDVMKTRYTTKHYDGSAVPAEKLEALLEVLRLTPTSVNSQPMRWFVAQGREARERLMPALMDFNKERVADAGALIVCAVSADMNEAHLRRVFEKEVEDGRWAGFEKLEGLDASRRGFVEMHRRKGDLAAWMTHQSYIAMGMLLLAAAQMGVDSTALEGVEFEKMDELLELPEKGLRTAWAVALGRRSADDKNAVRPKSRLLAEEVIVRLG